MDAVEVKFAPATGTDQEWNEAYARLADYFRAYRLHNRLRRTELVLESLKRAAETHAKDQSKKPVFYALEHAREMQRQWLSGIYSNLTMTGPQLEASGRLGFYLAGGPTRWPQHFMATKACPEEMVEAMQLAIRTSGPRLQISKMTPRSMDLGLTQTVEDAVDRFGKQPWARYVILAIFVSVVIGYVYHLLG
jgi:hypothetical protein